MKTFTIGEKITHTLFGEGTITEIEERFLFPDNTTNPIIWVQFDNPIRHSKNGEPIYKTRFTGTSLTEYLA
jgi:hypothetical protein